jgi:hypothetical protein
MKELTFELKIGLAWLGFTFHFGRVLRPFHLEETPHLTFHFSTVIVPVFELLKY